jgi:hypothetical protein
MLACAFTGGNFRLEISSRISNLLCIIATHLQEGSKIDANAYIHAPTIFPLASHFTDRTSAMATRRPLGDFRMHELQPRTLWHKRDDLIKAMPTR